MKTSHNELAARVAAVLPLTEAIEHAYRAVVDNAPHFSDDGLDYTNAAATVYAELVGLARVGGVFDDNINDYVAWLAQPAYETWGATDGDFRWWLADIIADRDPEASREWQDIADSAFDID